MRVNQVSSKFDYSEKISVSAVDKAAFLAFAGKAAKAAGAVTLPYFRANVAVENKLSNGKFDPVTEADKAAERVIRDELAKEFPTHGIYGEEYGYTSGNGLTWVIDPIDGTRAFMSGMLHWGVLLALFDGETPIVGAMYQPYTDELFLGDCDQAEMIRGSTRRILKTSVCETLGDAVLASTGVEWFEQDDRLNFERLKSNVKLCRFGGDCYLYGAVALGTVDIGTDASLNPYDIQALIPIVQGAGGVVTTYDGSNPSMGGAVVATANEVLHELALERLNS